MPMTASAYKNVDPSVHATIGWHRVAVCKHSSIKPQRQTGNCSGLQK